MIDLEPTTLSAEEQRLLHAEAAQAVIAARASLRAAACFAMFVMPATPPHTKRSLVPTSVGFDRDELARCLRHVACLVEAGQFDVQEVHPVRPAGEDGR